MKESQDAMAIFYKRMEMIENEDATESGAEEGEGKGPDALTEGESSEPGAHRRKRRGGRGSRMRRLLVHQLLLTEKRGLPLSRLLCLRRTEAKSQGRGGGSRRSLPPPY